MYWAKGVGAINAFVGGIVAVRANALAEPTKFIGIGGVPNRFVVRVGMEVVVFKHTAGSGVQDR